MKTWDAALYDNKLAMVARYGDGLLDMLDPTPGERILDLGCGTGRHARMIADRGAEVLGIDRASSMIEQARASFPELEFRIEDGESFRIDSPFDGVFSNAALHWMTSPEKVVRRVWEALRPGGRFVLEMGGQDNLLRLRAAIRSAMRALGYGEPTFPWFFPSIGAYASILEAQGFGVSYARHYERPTKMVDPESGLRDWLAMFATSIFAEVPSAGVEKLWERVEDHARADLYREGSWFVDYRRLQMVAFKPGAGPDPGHEKLRSVAQESR